MGRVGVRITARNRFPITLVDDPYREWADLDHLQAKHEVEDFVARVERGDISSPPLAAVDAVENEEALWQNEKKRAHGHASTAADGLASSQPGSWTGPTAQPAAPPATTSDSSTRRSTVSTDQYIARAANAIPNPDIDPVALTVEGIMHDRKVSKRRAYFILRATKQDEYTKAPVAESQRTKMLAVLYRRRGEIKNSTELAVALHEAGIETNGHDTVKVLWSLQKTGHVKFRERQSPRMLYAIHLTSKGYGDGKRYAEQPEIGRLSPTILPDVGHVPVQEPEANGWATIAAEVAADLTVPEAVEPEVAVNPVPTEEEEVLPALRAKPWTGDMGGFPIMREIRDRARKARKLTEAAKLLEEVGEDDLALSLMGKTEFSPLEEEVLSILRRYEEI